jgi:hypothetical protein
MTSAAELKRLIGQRKAITVPGTANALLARVIQDLGYEIVYVTGAGIANMSLGVPDIGLTTVTEVSETVAAIADVISVPLIVDGDTGFVNPLRYGFRQSAQHDSYRASVRARGRRRHTARGSSLPQTLRPFCRQGHYFHR